jgi:hypothetical protein
MDSNIELAKFELEKARIEGELRLKKAELDLKRNELESKLEEGSKRSTSPLTVAIITGIIGLLGAGVANILQSRSNLQLEREKFHSSAQLEREKFESELILKAIETGNPESATKNLLFLVDTGLIEDRTGKISALRKNPENAPVLPISNEFMLPATSYRPPKTERIITEIIVRESDTANLDAAVSVMRGGERGKMSYHYLIDKDGSINRLVPEEQVAIHNSPGHLDNSIAVGLVHLSGREDYPDVQINRLISLLAEISSRYHIETSKILTSNEISGNRPWNDINKIISRIREEVQKQKKADKAVR